MDVDESFAEYVAARWSMLYRLAALLVGEPGAEDLTQAALVRAYLAWPEVQEAASADDHVKRLLANTAVREPDDAEVVDSPASEPSDRERLWAEIAALPPRQRAMLVLRHYEGFSDAEIGRSVKCSTNTVTAEAGALETGIDLADLRGELISRADDALVSFPPIEALLEQGHQARRQRVRRATTRTAVVAAVVVVGLAVATVVQGRTSDLPRPLRPTSSAVEVPRFLSLLPRGRSPQIPYSVRHFLYIPGGRGIELNGRPAAIARTPRFVYVAYLSGAIVRVNTETVGAEPVVEASGGQLVTDPEGREVAWLQGGSGAAVVNLSSVDPTAFAGTDDVQAFPAVLRCCDNPFEVNGITEAGELIASLPAENRAWVWDTRAPRDEVLEITGMGNGVVSQVTAGGLVVHYPPFQYAVGQVEHGVFLQVDELAAVDADFTDPLGHRIVYADGDGEIHVREAALRGRSRRATPNITLRLPVLDDGYAAARWEDEDHVLLDVNDESVPDGALVRCDVRDGACELATQFEGPHLLAR